MYLIILDFGKFLNVGIMYIILLIIEIVVNMKIRLEIVGEVYWRCVFFFK